jgi:hypothetical protein
VDVPWTDDRSRPFEECFAAWLAAGERSRIMTDEQHAVAIRVLFKKETGNKLHARLTRQGYLVRKEADDKLTLHIRTPDTKAAPRGNCKTVQLAKAASAATIASASAAAIDVDDEDDVVEISPPPPRLVSSPATPPKASKTTRALSASEVPLMLAQTHATEIHSGARSTYLAMKNEFHAIPRIVCDAFVARCLVCAQKCRVTPNKYPIVAIKSSGFLSRVQISNKHACPRFEMMRIGCSHSRLLSSFRSICSICRRLPAVRRASIATCCIGWITSRSSASFDR